MRQHYAIFCFFSILSFGQSHPNILIIHTDDLGYHDLSIHGSKTYQTPHIDTLARQSVSFTKAYANYPRCVPSRFSMITGNYPIQNGNIPDDGFKIKNIAINKNFIKSFNTIGYQARVTSSPTQSCWSIPASAVVGGFTVINNSSTMTSTQVPSD